MVEPNKQHSAAITVFLIGKPVLDFVINAPGIAGLKK
jgi:hypothetical protein